MELQELMKTNVENLAQKQHDKLKEHTVETLKKVLNTIQLEEYDKINELIFSSPAGDGHGLNSHCINFNYAGERKHVGDRMDIKETTNTLINLKSKTQ